MTGRQTEDTAVMKQCISHTFRASHSCLRVNYLPITIIRATNVEKLAALIDAYV